MQQEFLKLLHLEEALDDLLAGLPQGISKEDVQTSDSAGRVLALGIEAPVDLPGFERSSMDGYALVAADTYGASEGLPAYLDLVGEVAMGEVSALEVKPGEAARISTGGAMPGGSDAVVMVENAELSGSTLEITCQVAPGENVLRADDDIAAGTPLFRRGTVLGPAQIGALAGLGIQAVTVYVPPTVAVISTGDELVGPGTDPGPAMVRDVNSPALSSAVELAGCRPISLGIVRDDVHEMLGACRGALASSDAVLLSGGSSAGVRDHTLQVMSELGSPGVLGHGLFLKPGKPTIVALCGGKPVIGLPGNPASALTVFRELVEPVLGKLKGEETPYRRVPRTVPAAMERSHPSDPGRMELIPVELVESESGLLAVPVAGKSMLIGTLARANGQVRVPEGKEGLLAGETVTVELL